MAKKRIEIDIKRFFSGKSLSVVYISLFGVILISTIMFGSVYHSGSMREGDISLRSIYAQHDFSYPWGINEEKTGLARDEALRNVPLIFHIDDSREEEMIERINIFFEQLKVLETIEVVDDRKAAVEDIRTNGRIDLSDSTIIYLAESDNKERIRKGVIEIIQNVYPLGIIDDSDQGLELDRVKFVKTINAKVAHTERVRNIEDIITVKKAQDIAAEYASGIFGSDWRLRQHVSDLLEKVIVSNVNYDSVETKELRKRALENVQPVYFMREVKKNELIVERGKRISQENIAQLMQLGVVAGSTHRGIYLLGTLLFMLISILICIGYFSLSEKKLIYRPKNVFIILINILIIIIIGQVIIQSPFSGYLIPISGFAMLITLLIGANVAFLMTVLLSIFLGLTAAGKVSIVAVMLVGGLTAIYVVRDARRRSRIIIAGFAAGVCQALMTLSMGMINNHDANIILQDSLWGLASGGLAICVVMVLLPVFEYGFKMTTNITLLELSDLNHPLLKELTLKAPGTYQHSIMVGNLAESACEAIGANSLLARVGAYYHDIGKIEKAEYFSENEMGDRSKHEKLTPSMSGLIIVNHVKDGAELARKYKLNSMIIDFIRQHHGTGLIYYFYQRALEKAHGENDLNEEEFRYPGPKPQTKECAIVLLADSVEASSRALSDPTPARIRGLVRKIINNKFIDNQLDECELTLTDLNKIADSFVRVLTAVFHTRLEYPDRKNNQGKTNGKNKR